MEIKFISLNKKETEKFAITLNDTNPLHKVNFPNQCIPGDYQVATSLIYSTSKLNIGDELNFIFKSPIIPSSILTIKDDKILVDEKIKTKIIRNKISSDINFNDEVIKCSNLKIDYKEFFRYFYKINLENLSLNEIIAANYCFLTGELSANGHFLKTLDLNRLNLVYDNKGNLKTIPMYTSSKIRILNSKKKLLENLDNLEIYIGIENVKEKLGIHQISFPFYLFSDKIPISQFTKTLICRGLEKRL